MPDWERWASTDSRYIKSWWAKHPQANPAIATGPAGLVVLDLDDGARHGRAAGHGKQTLELAAEQAGERVPWETFTVRTPNNGLHLYFAEPTDHRLHNTQGRLGPLVDSRAHGGYVLAADAQVCPGCYELVVDAPPLPLPPWLTAMLVPPEQTDSLATVHKRDVGAYIRAALTDEEARVRTAPPGTRRLSLLRAACRMGRLPGLHDEVVIAVLRAASDRHVADGAYSERERQRAISDGLKWGRLHPRQVITK